MAQQSHPIADLIVRQHHTAVSCRDWDAMKSFFVDLLGFKVLGEIENRDEAPLATVTGMPGAACRWAMLELGGYHIELFKWTDARRQADPDPPVRPRPHPHLLPGEGRAGGAPPHDRRRLRAAVGSAEPARRPRQAVLLPRPRRHDRRVRGVSVRVVSCFRPRAVRPRQESRGCDGYAGASSATLGPVPPGPESARLRAFLGNPVGLPGTLLGSLGVALRHPRDGVFCPGAVQSDGRSMGVTVGGITG